MNKAHRKESQLGRGIRSILNTKTGRVGFRVQVMVNGRRAQRIVDSYDAAVALRDQWLKEGTPVSGSATVAAPASQESDDGPAHTVEDAVRWYLTDLAHRERSAATIYQIQRMLARWPHDPIAGAFLQTPLTALDGHKVMDYLHDREEESRTVTGGRYKRASILREYRILHTAIKPFRRDLDWPNLRGKRGWTEGRVLPREPLSPEQKKRLLVALAEPYRTVAQLNMLLNPRRGSFAKMEQQHCHIDATNPWLLLPETKTHAEEIVPLEAEAITLIRAQMARHPGNRWLFPSPHKKYTTPITGGHFGRMVRQAAHAIGRPDFHFHCFRHQYGSELLARGFTVEQIAKAGRWGNAVRVYLHQRDADARDMQRALSAHPMRPGGRRRTSSAIG
jgi:integrase